ncbi:hypothetical protein [Enterobacter hormaechei]|uniref:hypothetical protein n=1 Tax=Enterobacter hormaechei TaxID=158836 RepID=UPI000D201E20|nr:hypothetical protein [Enterobacter hormaechei]AVJ78502.1 hypothetical protein CSC02_0039 [Enterobacter hormaechei subsp. hoffmannii]
MKLFEMEGFLRGKCIPRDLKVNETNAEYLVRKFAEADAKCAALAAENAGLKSAIEKHADSYIMCGYCRTERDGKNDDVCEVLDSIPATDAFLAEVRAAAVDEVCLKISNAIINCYQDEQIGLDAAATICGDFTAQLRKGVQS